MTNSPSSVQLWSPFRKRAGRAPLAALVAGVLAVVAIAPSANAAPGTWTQAQVNASIVKAVAYIDSQQNLNGSYGVSVPVAETGMALVAYSVLANGNFSSLPASYQL